MILRSSTLRRLYAFVAAVISVLLLVSTLVAAQSVEDAERASNQSLLWGPYRPNLYFGVRPRIPESLMLGLMWARVEDYQTVQENFRYTCEQHAGMAGYGWQKYDPRHGGIQTIHDAGNQIDITTSFFKDTSDSAGGKGGNWGVRVKGVPREDAPENLKTTMIVNAYMEGKPGVYNNLAIEVGDENSEGGFDGDVVLKGEALRLGQFKLAITGDGEKSKNKHPSSGHPSNANKALDKTFAVSKVVEPGMLWQAKPLLFALMKGQIDEYLAEYTEANLPPPSQLYTIKTEAGSGNVHFVQKVFEGAFEFDILFSSAAAEQAMTSSALEAGVEKIVKTFDKRWEASFKPQAPFTAAKYVEFSKSLFSNLLGGIGYFYGDARVDRSAAPEYEEENEGFWEETAEARARAQISPEGPNELFTATPSRPFFPRGFLWDEGFHLMPVVDWDADLTLQIIKSWFSLIDEDGWIGREQILGPEARSKVPEEFQVQYPHYANPPTLFLTLTRFIDKLTSATKSDDEFAMSKEVALTYLKDLYPLLKRHYEWFRSSQKGDISSYDRKATNPKEAYRWRGRTERHCLTSGQDDFPRAQPPHPGELHVDALAWVGLMSDSLIKMATFLGEDDDVEIFSRHLSAIKSNLIDLHWSDKEGLTCDATIDEYEEHALVCHKGYVSLVPFMVGLLDETAQAAKIKRILALIADPAEIWSNHGIRSLSQRDELYGTDENYWRSPVWIPMNYLILVRLYTIGAGSSSNAKEAGRLYTLLRKNLVDTVYESWKETGFAWEQYDPETGKGQRTQHFTGWTSLIVKVLQMPEKVKQGQGVRDEL